VHHHAPGIAVVTVHGEHDLSTEPALTRALEEAAAHSNVLVDLSECEFIDSTVIAALLRVARTVTDRGERFALLIPAAQRQITRIAEMTHLGELLPIHPAREAALASLEEPAAPDAAP
jgi:anti-anti-sigma factor